MSEVESNVNGKHALDQDDQTEVIKAKLLKTESNKVVVEGEESGEPPNEHTLSSTSNVEYGDGDEDEDASQDGSEKQTEHAVAQNDHSGSEFDDDEVDEDDSDVDSGEDDQEGAGEHEGSQEDDQED